MNSLQIFIESPVIERLGWTLLHSAWQGLGVALVLALLLPAIRRRGARAAYAVCCGALLLTILLPAITFCIVPESPRTRVLPGRITHAAGAIAFDPDVGDCSDECAAGARRRSPGRSADRCRLAARHADQRAVDRQAFDHRFRAQAARRAGVTADSVFLG
jgi:hypothetical protein